MAVLCILFLHVKWSHLLALQITEHIQRLRRHESIWNCCHISHLPSLLSSSSRSTLELILRFLLSEASLPKGFLSVQSRKHGRASKSERMLVLSLMEALKKAKVGQAKLSVFWDSWTEQSPSSLLVPWLLSAHLASSCSFFLPLLQDSSQPADGTKRFWIGKLTWYSLSNDALHHRGWAETSLYKDKSTLFLGLDGLHDKNDHGHTGEDPDVTSFLLNCIT